LYNGESEKKWSMQKRNIPFGERTPTNEPIRAKVFFCQQSYRRSLLGVRFKFIHYNYWKHFVLQIITFPSKHTKIPACFHLVLTRNLIWYNIKTIWLVPL
jgi:hypothetical protein